MTTAFRAPIWQRAIIVMSGAVLGLAIVLGLQWGRPILIPIALAALLTFLLNPIVRVLEFRGFGRIFSVLLAVTTVGILLLCLGWMVTRQVAGLLASLPQNTANIKAKVKTLRALGSGPFADQFGQMVEEISQEIQRPSYVKLSVGDGDEDLNEVTAASPAKSMSVQTDSSFWPLLTGYCGSAFEVMATLAFALVLLVFFLIGREDLRDRVVLLAGKARLAVTSKALEDITERISRYIVVMAMINGGFGVLLTSGLFLLGVPYALLWGFLAAGLRFLPYIGPWVGALLPIVMSLATFEGWWQPLAVFVYVLALEMMCSNVVEPLVLGHSTGVSPTALLISAAFWLYLWGPIGLVLSAPFAVCLVVLGKNIAQLGFLHLLLGDAPALRANVGIYQRLMLGDRHEAIRLVLQRMKALPSDEVYDGMLIPALNYTKRDFQRDQLTFEDRQTILEGMREALQQADKLRALASGNHVISSNRPLDVAKDSALTVVKPAVLLCCPATDDMDCVGIEMLRQLLDATGWRVEIAATESSTPVLMAQIARDLPDAICIASMPPGGLAHALHLCECLREASPTIPVIVGRWGQKRKNKFARERLERTGASFVATTLLETRNFLDHEIRHLPVCAGECHSV